MKKIALVYYSMSGNVEFVSKKIAEELEVDLIKIIPKKEYPNKGYRKFFWGGKSAIMKETPSLENNQLDISKYDEIIIGTPVWASTFAPPIRTFIKENKEELKKKIISVFVTCSGSGANNTINKLKEYIEIENFKHTLILIDPKEKETDDKNRKIKEYCNQISSNK